MAIKKPKTSNKSGSRPTSGPDLYRHEKKRDVAKGLLPLSEVDFKLHKSIEDKDLNNVYKSLWKSANVNVLKPAFGSSPLAVACRKGDAKIVAALLQFGANPSIADDYGVTPLHWAVNSRSKTAVKVLMDKGKLGAYDLSRRDHYGSTPLHFASILNLSDMSEVLLDKGSDPSALNNEGRKPSELASDDTLRRFLLDEELRYNKYKLGKARAGKVDPKAVVKATKSKGTKKPTKKSEKGGDATPGSASDRDEASESKKSGSPNSTKPNTSSKSRLNTGTKTEIVISKTETTVTSKVRLGTGRESSILDSNASSTSRMLSNSDTSMSSISKLASPRPDSSKIVSSKQSNARLGSNLTSPSVRRGNQSQLDSVLGSKKLASTSNKSSLRASDSKLTKSKKGSKSGSEDKLRAKAEMAVTEMKLS